MKYIFFLFFTFFTVISFSSPLVNKNFLVSQDDSLFDESDLIDIEGTDVDKSLEDDFDSIGENDSDEAEGTEDNFDEDNFEIVEEEEDSDDLDSNDENLTEDSIKDDFDIDNYEIISDRPDYEVIDDKELEQEFSKGNAETEEDSIEEPGEKSLLKLEDVDDDEVLDGGDSLEDDSSQEPAEPLDEEDDSLQEPAKPSDEEDDSLQEPAEPLDEEDDSLQEPAEPSDEEDDLKLLEEEESKGSADSGTLNLISNIRYLAKKDQIIIDCSEPTSYQVRTNTETNQYIIEILQARLADNLHWPYVLKEFNTNFGLIKADQKDSITVRIIIQLKEGASFPQSTLTESNDQIVVAYGQIVGNQIIQDKKASSPYKSSDNILPAKTLEDLYFEDIQFSGTPISFHVIDAPVKQVLRFISEESGLNMVIGENVTGTVTLKLEDVPWDQALHTIFKVKSLGYTRDGNVITILPLTEIETRTKKLKEISDRQKSLSPYETKVIPVNYAKINEIEAKVKDFSTPKSEFSKGGRIIIHPESNTFIVIDTPEVIRKIESIVRYLDKAPKQVLVEAKIVEVAESFTRNFGLTWGLGGSLPVTINASGFVDLIKNIGGNYRFRNNANPLAFFSLNGLPIIGDLSASLSLAESDGYAQVISTPKVVVISGKTATITRDSPIFVPTSTTTTTTPGGDTSEQQTVEKESVSIKLTVTATVTTTGSVFLNVDVTRSDPGGRGESFKTERSAKSEVLVKNGQTVVIGGIYEKDEVKQDDGIPFLRHVPFLSMLFNTVGVNRSKAELLIFITPKLLDINE